MLPEMYSDQQRHEARMYLLNEIAKLMTTENLVNDFDRTMLKVEGLRSQLRELDN